MLKVIRLTTPKLPKINFSILLSSFSRHIKLWLFCSSSLSFVSLLCIALLCSAGVGLDYLWPFFCSVEILSFWASFLFEFSVFCSVFVFETIVGLSKSFTWRQYFMDEPSIISIVGKKHAQFQMVKIDNFLDSFARWCVKSNLSDMSQIIYKTALKFEWNHFQLMTVSQLI